jgi:hypothetical protein
MLPFYNQASLSDNFQISPDKINDENKGGTAAQENSPREPLTLAGFTQLLLREAILSGSANGFCNHAHLWIEKARLFLNYTDTGVEILNNIINVTKDNIVQRSDVKPGSEMGVPLSMPVSPWKLFWDLICTSEFQQFFGRLLAQVLQPKTT